MDKLVKKLDPKNDVIFQKIFGTKANKDILISFLDAILEDKKIDLDTIEFEEKILNSEMIIDEKIGILDIRAKTKEGIQINIEIQLINQYNMIQRTMFYWSKLFFSQIKSGSLYNELKKTITINILNFNYLSYDDFISKHHIYEDKSKVKLSDILEIDFIEMKKFIEVKMDLNNPLHRWLLFLTNPEDELMGEIEMGDPKIKKAHDVLESLSLDDELLRLAELREKYILDESSRLEGAKEEGLKKGKEEGMKEGKEKGLKEGLKEGEHKKAMEIAKSLLDVLDIKTISLKTGLSEEEIRKLKI